MKTILVTGGAGYIGSHTVVALITAGYQPVIADNFANSKPSVLERLEKITGQKVPFADIDISDTQKLHELFKVHNFDAAIHFAGLKAVGESVSQPLVYYRQNIDSTLSLCEVMQEQGVKKLIFSSSAVVYGEPSELPLKETSRVGIGITNPYGQTKYMIEQILKDLTVADPSWQITSLRYFNPIGAHESGLIGEDPNDVPNNLLPYISQVAVGKLEKLRVYGNDYDTVDGTGVRDYIHVVDLAKGHVAALEHSNTPYDVFNLGTGHGTSVLELLKAFSEAAGKDIPHEVAPRRPGDVAACYADVSKAERELKWKAEKSIAEACKDSWKWQQFIAANT